MSIKNVFCEIVILQSYFWVCFSQNIQSASPEELALKLYLCQMI